METITVTIIINKNAYEAADWEYNDRSAGNVNVLNIIENQMEDLFGRGNVTVK